MVPFEHRSLALLLMDRTQHCCMDEDPAFLHRCKIHVQARDRLVGQTHLLDHPGMYRAAYHLADL